MTFKSLKNKKGLSTVITTLSIVLLVLVAIGIIWLVVSNLVKKGTEQSQLTANCLEADLQITYVSIGQDTNGTYLDATIQRSSGGSNLEIPGFKLLFYYEAGENFVMDIEGNLGPLETSKVNVYAGNAPTGMNPLLVEKIEVAPFFLDSKGLQYICPVTDYVYNPAFGL